ncbi:MAG: DEAD/DEAH box helicase [Spirochaetes bacterium]|nr:DEAD/DEAH box helicase [Spirochaetota bacterium]
MLKKEKENTIEKILNEIKQNIRLIYEIKERDGIYEEYPDEIDQKLKEFFQNEGIKKLYRHQYLSYNKLKENKNILITTPTASGKSLCYNLYILDYIIKNKVLSPKAIYIFPTKALTSDQVEKLDKINDFLKKVSEFFNIYVYQYDGDTPSSIRSAVRINGDIILTNPDMLHNGILPNHTKWSKFFQNLKFIVIDELHVYKGIFGSHFALLIERLKRIAKFYGNINIQFILLSATISNAKEHAEKVINEEVFHIDENGAPIISKKFIFYNPPLIKGLNIRRGILSETVKISSKLLKNTEFQIINFFPSRLYVELASSYLKKLNKDLENEISSYRGGYLPKERKEIEKKLKEKKIRYVSSTNALELGIDIGSFDVCIISGFPDSIASFFQQAGRAGRKGNSYVFFIASNSPIDQYFMDNPEIFFKMNPEKPMINPYNKYVYYSHLKCALFELPFNEDEKFYSFDPSSILNEMTKENVAKKEKITFYYTDNSFPAENVSLRNSDPENYVIIDTTNNKNIVIGEMDRISAFSLLFPKAIYLHRSQIYEVVELDIRNSKAFIKEVSADYYTDALTKTDIEILKQIKEKLLKLNNSNLLITYLNVMVTTTVFKYKKIKFFTSENVGYGDISLPSYQFPTESIFIGFDDIRSILDKMKKEFIKEKENELDKNIELFIFYLNNDLYLNEFISEIINSLAYQSLHIFALILSCDKKDLGYSDFLKSPFYNIPGFFIFDKIYGGVNLSKEMFNLLPEVFKNFIDRIDNCSCEKGCISCIGIIDEFNGYKKINKKIIKKFLENIIC